MINEIDLYYYDENGFDKELMSANVHLSFLFRMLLGKYDVGKFKKVLLKLTSPTIEVSNGVAIVKGKVSDLIDIVELWIEFDKEKYYSKDVEARRLDVWECIKNGLFSIASFYKSDTTVIENAYKVGIERALKCEFVTQYSEFNNKLKLNGTLVLEGDENAFVYYCLLNNEAGDKVDKIKIAEFRPYDGYEIAYFVKKVKWINNTFVVELKNKKRYSCEVLNNV
ncbi:hypothetical protein SAMN05421788_101540 [Filimonas lacunae]|uniref:Uncharacterized protein n=1 Tax=Filimonas lacunae TaxID=477680 RepID=A0A173MN76_9BACT|nr:hypothetical protein [Filimonas lacunae]BAV09093.1 hypothetical protein FLA_5141 [Filimonas lacunae]SIS67198.1 hypothetical protein SAMN05421788_101540 [Filimonas lacunae]